ncbi:glutamate--tRNA ligase [Desulforamulus hydrothermalis]|uniref:Glutamate--tRNA ligase n=1 Tax=Desulforamulus hydrothermalis Lam5 = DSM 18033 TaxID=1121428 RepID=K8DY89_9FIRM|nr:glutamate--tRNA ligase [Desulforamulus hydrothermalis]CCO07772.1 Glutamate--tRNA ligase [Desulforamulus hydrothermalis Lam5 = DSM 18033]SHH39686.1 glutamyl-tRNA synthetase [Desulforamulus hydrothermalis Lam5 = DSM 18033]
MSVRVRFAPSPTGPLHIGGARSALFNWLFARHHGGRFIVRIEDTDLERSSRESEENILNALHWLGIDWDEGIQTGGPNGPYRQTERLSVYRQLAAQLLAKGQAYYCYCTEEELAAEREELLARGELPRYLGRCRHLSEEAKAKLAAEGRKPVLRFRVPENRIIIIQDRVRGQVEFESNGIGDFIIMKSDNIPTYNFAVVVDDHDMNITHVIRAEEHLSNTPRQILLYEALGWPQPEFAHISLILGKDRAKMSKRHGATAIEQYQKLGYLPEALVNFLALLGWSPGGEQEILSLPEIVEQFSLDRVAKNPAVFDIDKLNWLNGHYIRQSPLDRLTRLAVPYLMEAGYLDEAPDAEKLAWLEQVVAIARNYISYMQEITQHVDIFFRDEVIVSEAEARDVLTWEQMPAVMEAACRLFADAPELTEESVKGIIKAIGKQTGLKGKFIFQPLRVAITGRTHGPELHQIIPVIGKERTVARLRAVLRQSSPPAGQ